MQRPARRHALGLAASFGLCCTAAAQPAWPTLVVTTPNVLVVNPQVAPVSMRAELVAWMTARPGQVFHATSGIGASPHLTMELFTQMTGTEATHVPSRGGATAVMDQLGGTVQVSTPAPLRERIAAEITAILREPAVSQVLEQGGYTVAAGTPAAYAAFQRADIARWRRVAQAANIRVE
jgi:tripartite-type tricarboxylate transporter receptor subunit TctC